MKKPETDVCETPFRAFFEVCELGLLHKGLETVPRQALGIIDVMLTGFGISVN